MNMMPRWDGGYGWQILYESLNRDNLLQAKRVVGSGWTEDVQQVSFQDMLGIDQ